MNTAQKTIHPIPIKPLPSAQGFKIEKPLPRPLGRKPLITIKKSHSSSVGRNSTFHHSKNSLFHVFKNQKTLSMPHSINCKKPQAINLNRRKNEFYKKLDLIKRGKLDETSPDCPKIKKALSPNARETLKANQQKKKNQRLSEGINSGPSEDTMSSLVPILNTPLFFVPIKKRSLKKLQIDYTLKENDQKDKNERKARFIEYDQRIEEQYRKYSKCQLVPKIELTNATFDHFIQDSPKPEKDKKGDPMANMLIFLEKAFDKCECGLGKIIGVLEELKANKVEIPFGELNDLIEKLIKKKEDRTFVQRSYKNITGIVRNEIAKAEGNSTDFEIKRIGTLADKDKEEEKERNYKEPENKKDESEIKRKESMIKFSSSFTSSKPKEIPRQHVISPIKNMPQPEINNQNTQNTMVNSLIINRPFEQHENPFLNQIRNDCPISQIHSNVNESSISNINVTQNQTPRFIKTDVSPISLGQVNSNLSQIHNGKPIQNNISQNQNANFQIKDISPLSNIVGNSVSNPFFNQPQPVTNNQMFTCSPHSQINLTKEHQVISMLFNKTESTNTHLNNPSLNISPIFNPPMNTFEPQPEFRNPYFNPYENSQNQNLFGNTNNFFPPTNPAPTFFQNNNPTQNALIPREFPLFQAPTQQSVDFPTNNQVNNIFSGTNYDIQLESNNVSPNNGNFIENPNNVSFSNKNLFNVEPENRNDASFVLFQNPNRATAIFSNNNNNAPPQQKLIPAPNTAASLFGNTTPNNQVNNNNQMEKKPAIMDETQLRLLEKNKHNKKVLRVHD